MAELDHLANQAASSAAAPGFAIQSTAPAQERAALDGNTRLRQLPWCGKINLRGEPHNPQFLQAACKTLGDLPLLVNHTATCAAEDIAAPVLIFCLGPNEWLLHCELESTAELLSRLRQNLARIHHAVTEVTDYYSVLELHGEHAGAALARGCPLDLHERVLQAQRCAQTHFGNASILLYKPTASPLFNLQVRWSFTTYVWDYLARAIHQLQCAEA